MNKLALVVSFCCCSLLLDGCGGGSSGNTGVGGVHGSPPLAFPLENAETPLNIPTFDGSGQVTEPDVLRFDLPWEGFRYWMVVSPYPNSDASKENPSIVVSDDGITWEVPPGLVNPLAVPIEKNYLADASIFYDHNSSQLWVYYLETLPGTEILNVKRLSSTDGAHWQNLRTVFEVPFYDALSPTVEKTPGGYYMWAVNTGAGGCYSGIGIVEYRFSTDGLNWSTPKPTNLAQSGYVIWHLNVSYVPSKHEYWAVVAAYANGSTCDSTVLFYSKSVDGINWTSYDKPVLVPGTRWDNEEIYRSTLTYDPTMNRLRVWYSARSASGEWHVGLAEEDYDQFLEWLQP